MKADIKKLWVDALRSGDYKQYTNGALRKNENCFCVVGVLCDVTKDITGLEWKCVAGIWYFGAMYANTPNAVDLLYGCGGKIPTLRHKDYMGRFTLTHLNDIKQVNFYELADLIEEQL